MFKSALLLLSGNAFSSLMLLLRNLLIARLISVEDYGIAATFAISMAIVEMMSTLGLHQLIVQDKNGDDPEFQANLQGFHLLRSLISGLLLLALAHPLARFLGIPDIAWAYQLLALIPVLRGFVHFDIYRLQRQMSYFPLILSSSIPALLSVVLIWPLVVFFPDYRAMLYALFAQSIAMVIASHVVSQRRYRLRLDFQTMTRTLNFGWPLLINNIMLFGIFHGEKLIVGREIGMETLALLAMGIVLTLNPTLILAKSAQSFFLPQLSATKEDEALFRPLALATLQSSILNGLLLLAIITFFGPSIIQLLLGQKYDALTPYLIWMAILNAIRVFKAGSSVVALAKAQTSNAMIANSFRIASLPISWLALVKGGDLLLVLQIAITAEILGYVTSLALLHFRLKLDLSRMSLPVAAAFIICPAALAYTTLPYQNTPTWMTGLLLLGFCLCFATMRDLLQYAAKRSVTKYSS